MTLRIYSCLTWFTITLLFAIFDDTWKERGFRFIFMSILYLLYDHVIYELLETPNKHF